MTFKTLTLTSPVLLEIIFREYKPLQIMLTLKKLKTIYWWGTKHGGYGFGE